MKRPHVYGSEANLRAALARYLERADDLLAQAGGVRNRIAALPLHAEGRGYFIEDEWAKAVRQWFSRARRAISPYLQEQLEDVLPVLALGLPPDTGKPRHAVGLDNGEPWLRKAREELQDVQAALGVSRGVARAAPPPARFAELHASGLVGEKVINDHAKEMLNPRTARQLANGIAAAKELTEATLRAALDQLGETYGRGDDLPKLMRKWRQVVGNLAPPDPKAQGTLDSAQAALANLVTFLGRMAERLRTRARATAVSARPETAPCSPRGRRR